MEQVKDISEVIEEQAALLDSEDGIEEETADVSEDAVEEQDAEAEDERQPDDEEATEKVEEKAEPEGEEEAVKQEEPTGLQAPENWSEDIKAAFSKVDKATQEVWLNQHKEFQRGFNTVAQEASELRRYQQANAGVDTVLSQVIPMWRQQGMTPEQGLGQLVQLGVAYATNPSDTILHLAKMAGLDIRDIGRDAPYRTSDDIARDTHLSQLEKKVQQFELQQLQSNIDAFQNETDAEGGLKHPLFNEAIDGMTQLYNRGFNGTMEEAYNQVVWLTPELRERMQNPVVQNNEQMTNLNRNANANRAKNAVNQRVKKPKPAPSSSDEFDGLSDDDLVARVAAGLERNG